MSVCKSVLSFLRKLAFHPNPFKRCCISLLYIGAGIACNFLLLQVFCVPVLWAAIYFAVFVAVFLLVPWLMKLRLANWLAAFVLGAGIPLCLYLIIFLADPWVRLSEYFFYAVAVLLGGIGLIAFIPFYLLYHILRYYRMATESLWRACFWTGCLLPVIALMLCMPQFRKSDLALTSALQSRDWRSVPVNYFTERLTGIGFKYHTKLEFVYDGWRPPLHDPFLNIYLWFYSDTYFPHWPVNRLMIYRKLFPQKPVWVNCACSYTYDGMTYFRHDTSAFIPRSTQ